MKTNKVLLSPDPERVPDHHHHQSEVLRDSDRLPCRPGERREDVRHRLHTQTGLQPLIKAEICASLQRFLCLFCLCAL